MKLSEWVNRQLKAKALERRERIARGAGVREPAVRHWVNGTRQIPANKVLSIYRSTNSEVTPFEQRPDLYPDPDWLPALERQDSAGTDSSKEVA
ncbi:MAG: YdaS family helix-turn-helix protein [Pseudomonadota bacterium]|nr:YdaS family helix-turn-helix protein [Pseudomonadota bacterium]